MYYRQFDIVKNISEIADLFNQVDLSSEFYGNKKNYKLLVKLVYFSTYIIDAMNTMGKCKYKLTNLSLQQKSIVLKHLNIIFTKYMYLGELSHQTTVKDKFNTKTFHFIISRCIDSSFLILSINCLLDYIRQNWFDVYINSNDLDNISSSNSNDVVDFCKEYAKLYLIINEYAIYKPPSKCQKKDVIISKILPNFERLLSLKSNKIQLISSLLNTKIKNEFELLFLILPKLTNINRGVIPIANFFTLLNTNTTYNIFTPDEISSLLCYVVNEQITKVFKNIKQNQNLVSLIKENIFNSTGRIGINALYFCLFKNGMIYISDEELKEFANNINQIANEFNKFKGFEIVNHEVMRLCGASVFSSYGPVIKKLVKINKNNTVEILTPKSHPQAYINLK